jgi:hypothetical protein
MIGTERATSSDGALGHSQRKQLEWMAVFLGKPVFLGQAILIAPAVVTAGDRIQQL